MFFAPFAEMLISQMNVVILTDVSMNLKRSQKMKMCERCATALTAVMKRKVWSTASTDTIQCELCNEFFCTASSSSDVKKSFSSLEIILVGIFLSLFGITAITLASMFADYLTGIPFRPAVNIIFAMIGFIIVLLLTLAKENILKQLAKIG
jgi:H+/Cl- antiporter ClcA